MVSKRASQPIAVSALLFVVSAAVTIVWCESMPAMGGMPMLGGWTMSMASEQTWPGAATSFLGMWVVMMVAMMLPSLVPMLLRHREAVGRTGETRVGRLTVLVGVGYLFVWTVFGMAVFPLGVALMAIEMQQPALTRAVPIAVGVVVLIAGALQFSAWKARHLTWCRPTPARSVLKHAVPQSEFDEPPIQRLEAGGEQNSITIATNRLLRVDSSRSVNVRNVEAAGTAGMRSSRSTHPARPYGHGPFYVARGWKLAVPRGTIERQLSACQEQILDDIPGYPCRKTVTHWFIC